MRITTSRRILSASPFLPDMSRSCVATTPTSSTYWLSSAPSHCRTASVRRLPCTLPTRVSTQPDIRSSRPKHFLGDAFDATMATPQCHPSPSSERDVGAIIPDAILLEQCRTCRKKDGVNGIKLRACTPCVQEERPHRWLLQPRL
ncbi:hypothetical protein BD309DRAFT_951823 [Dichomitus squalens]|uniref:Uncharacterized protein n=1 Tax=Dichomitus squalens TaxID=114155 RepID=A0A4Q9PTB1_9APHY|nr:hypothetical protein BD309DRAFT_951823 [Dichomitus squalens]TBU57686.1 hypothetical protein BD310DRAFT_537183 [Dichomitus squalens]